MGEASAIRRPRQCPRRSQVAARALQQRCAATPNRVPGPLLAGGFPPVQLLDLGAVLAYAMALPPSFSSPFAGRMEQARQHDKERHGDPEMRVIYLFGVRVTACEKRNHFQRQLCRHGATGVDAGRLGYRFSRPDMLAAFCHHGGADRQRRPEGCTARFCPNCERTWDYAIADMVVFEAAQGGPISTA